MADKSDVGLNIDFREFFELRMDPIRQEMAMMRRAIEKLSEGMISASEWQRMNERCHLQETEMAALQKRVEDLEHYHNVGMWAFRIVVGVITAVATAALIAYLVG